eukprot:s6921_g1.t1
MLGLCAGVRFAVPKKGADKRSIDGELGAVPEREAVAYDLDAPGVVDGHIKVHGRQSMARSTGTAREARAGTWAEREGEPKPTKEQDPKVARGDGYMLRDWHHLSPAKITPRFVCGHHADDPAANRWLGAGGHMQWLFSLVLAKKTNFTDSFVWFDGIPRVLPCP